MSEFFALPIADDIALIAFAALVGLSFTIWASDAIRRYMSSPTRSKNRNLAMKIVDRGGPRALREQHLLFPEACPKCGSRKIVHVEWDSLYFFSYDWLINHFQLMNIAMVCDRCNYHLEGDSTSKIISDYCTRKVIKVNSPYLSDDKSETIPDFLVTLNEAK